jgi:hypothetical protein
VREVVPADLNESIAMPNESIKVSKACYDDIHFKEDHLEEGFKKEVK